MADETGPEQGVQLFRVRPAGAGSGHRWFLAVRDYAVDRVVKGHATSGNVAEVVGWNVLPGVEDAACAKVLRYQGGSFQLIGRVEGDKWALWGCPVRSRPCPKCPPRLGLTNSPPLLRTCARSAR
jgi:hypothetical protein